MRVNKLVRLKLSRNYGGPASLLKKERLLQSFSDAQVIIVRVFLIFSFLIT